MITRSKINYNLNFACILTTGRTGSDFLQGCLDGVPGIITFSGEVPFYTFLNDPKVKKIFKSEDCLKLILIFIKKHHNLFFSDNLENKKINLNLIKFKKIFLKLSEGRKFNKKTFLINLYLAYHLTLNRIMLKKNVIVHHSHSVLETELFLNDFKDSKVLVTIRNPMQNLKSGIDNWVKYDPKKKNFEHFYLYIRRIREDLNFALKKKSHFVKLEEMNLDKTKKKILKFLNIKYSKLINRSTFAGRLWRSDKLSNFKARKGKYDTSVVSQNWESYFSRSDQLILSFLYNKYDKFGYKIKKLTFIQKIYLPILFFFPLKFERKMILQIFLNSHFPTFKKNIYFYVRKVLYFINIYLLKVIYD